MDSFPQIAGQASSMFPQLVCTIMSGFSSSDVHALLATSAEVKLQTAAACKAARDNGIRICAMTGEGGGRLAEHADVLLAVPSKVTMHIQESHIALGHVMTLAVERLMDL